MISFEQSALLILILYAISSICGIAGLLLRQRWLRIVACLFAVAGFGVQTFDMVRGSHAQNPEGLSLGTYLQILAWFMLLCAFFSDWKTRHSTPTIFMVPLVLMLFLFSLQVMHAQIALPESLTGLFYALHIGTLYISLAMMTLAFVAGLIFVYIEKKIKSKAPITGFSRDFPALAILDKTNAIATFVGFPLFTVGIISGIVWASSTWGKAVSGDPKEVIAFFTWGLYAWLFHMRVVQSRGGRKPAILALWLFALSLFSILVVNLLMDTHHSFIQ